MKIKSKKRGERRVIVTLCLFAICLALTIGCFMTIPNKATINARADAENKLTNAVVIAEGTSYHTETSIGYSIGLTANETYTINYTINGTNYVSQKTALNYSTIENSIILGGTEQETIWLLPEGATMETAIGYIQITDKAVWQGEIGSQSSNMVADADNTNITVSYMGDDGLSPAITINSITAGTTAPTTPATTEDLNAGTIIGSVTGSFTSLLEGIGTSIGQLFEDVFINAEGGLSVLAIVALSLMGLGLATGMIKLILSKV